MAVLFPRCCALDVHKLSITACILLAKSGKPLKHIRVSDAQSENFVIAAAERAECSVPFAGALTRHSIERHHDHRFEHTVLGLFPVRINSVESQIYNRKLTVILPHKFAYS
jgi:hypothetical protein